jgi:soluble lytic murein transglycosylase-like protein
LIDWKAGGETYLPALSAAEINYGIPTDLLARIAYQESAWREDIVNGTTRSSAGAVGLMQLMPQFFPGAGISWHDDIIKAGQYLVTLYRTFGDWQLAVAAYNWGPGHMQKYVAGTYIALPLETENYVKKVFTDVPIDGEILHA